MRLSDGRRTADRFQFFSSTCAFSSASDDWPTPQWLFDQQNAKWRFDLDAAASATNAKCRKFYTIADDALRMPWRGVVQPAVWPDVGTLGTACL